MIYTKKQRQLLGLWKRKQLRRINLLEGSVSSGKTWVSLVLWGFWVATMPADKLYLMCGKSLTTLKRNCLIPLEELFGRSNFQFSTSAKEAYLFGRRILLEGANDARSESKIRGLTLQGAYCDELTLFPKDFFVMLLSRLRVPGAKLIATTNPDSPEHWLKKEYIDRRAELDMLVVRFLLDDNTTLDPQYVTAVKAEYTGVFYNRFILGEWCLAEGIVYPQFDRTQHVRQLDSPQGKWYISVDYGTLNAFSAGLWCYDGKQAYRAAEWYYSGRAQRRQLTNTQYLKHIQALAGGRNIEAVVVDPSAASFITELRQAGFTVRKGKNDVVDGIRRVSTALQQGKLLFSPACQDCIREFSLYRWDEKAAEDRPIKENDHAMDDVRYFVNTVLRQPVTLSHSGLTL
ncbi:PBSX family phage terminase large subunit [Ruminococcus callidus]|jgi:PBSX family phage terminase large subunit|uniref:PBSX family phage terminase large subunit n=1 Tax=Ruminococcus callidus TaxID=40519 RepID=UPI000EBC79C2|nr:PBSX family phage terminase large subunit [Ruminococcus callidus]UWD59230.1 MAG: Terminase [Bacteriophage sp.]UWI39743.1 MAG: Terminase [Bacteriophage sp.]HCD40328.1 PBSX family phage terminase large subunit [Ruminococcus sp.]